MECISFLTMLNDEYGIDDTTKSHEEILQDIGEIDGTGFSEITITAMQKKFHSCTGSDEEEITFESETAKKSQGSRESMNPEKMWMRLDEGQRSRTKKMLKLQHKQRKGFDVGGVNIGYDKDGTIRVGNMD